MKLQDAGSGVARWYALFDGINPSWVRYVTAISVGVMIALTVGIADPSGDLLKMIIAVDGFILAFISSRLLDAFADTRKSRRQVYLALLRIRRLSRELAVFLDENREGAVGDSESLMALNLAHMAAIGLSSRTPPDFGEIIDTNDDLAAATGADHAFHALHALFGVSPPPEKLADSLRVVLSPDGLGLLEEHNRTLDKAAAHFAARLGKPSPFNTLTIEEDVVRRA